MQTRPGMVRKGAAIVDTINIDEAKAKLSQLVDKAALGEDVVLSRNGRPLVRITQLEPRRRVRFGVLKGKLEVSPDFDSPLPDQVLAGFEGR